MARFYGPSGHPIVRILELTWTSQRVMFDSRGAFTLLGHDEFPDTTHFVVRQQGIYIDDEDNEWVGAVLRRSDKTPLPTAVQDLCTELTRNMETAQLHVNFMEKFRQHSACASLTEQTLAHLIEGPLEDAIWFTADRIASLVDTSTFNDQAFWQRAKTYVEEAKCTEQ